MVDRRGAGGSEVATAGEDVFGGPGVRDVDTGGLLRTTIDVSRPWP